MWLKCRHLGNASGHFTFKGTEVTFCSRQMSSKNTCPYQCPFHFGIPCGHLFRVPLRLTLQLECVQNKIAYCMGRRSRGFRPLISNDISVSWHCRMRNKGSFNVGNSNANLPIKGNIVRRNVTSKEIQTHTKNKSIFKDKWRNNQELLL